MAPTSPRSVPRRVTAARHLRANETGFDTLDDGRRSRLPRAAGWEIDPPLPFDDGLLVGPEAHPSIRRIRDAPSKAGIEHLMPRGKRSPAFRLGGMRRRRNLVADSGDSNSSDQARDRDNIEGLLGRK